MAAGSKSACDVGLRGAQGGLRLGSLGPAIPQLLLKLQNARRGTLGLLLESLQARALLVVNGWLLNGNCDAEHTVLVRAADAAGVNCLRQRRYHNRVWCA